MDNTKKKRPPKKGVKPQRENPKFCKQSSFKSLTDSESVFHRTRPQGSQWTVTATM